MEFEPHSDTNSWSHVLSVRSFLLFCCCCFFFLSCLDCFLLSSFIGDTPFVEVKCNFSFLWFFGRVIYLWGPARSIGSRKTNTQRMKHMCFLYSVSNEECRMNARWLEITDDNPVFNTTCDRQTYKDTQSKRGATVPRCCVPQFPF